MPMKKFFPFFCLSIITFCPTRLCAYFTSDSEEPYSELHNFASSSFPTETQPQESSFDESDDDLFAMDSGPIQLRDQCPPPDFDILTFLLLLNAPEVLQNDLYKRTNQINQRPLHSLPSLQPYFRRPCHARIDAQAFANVTNRMFFTRCSPFIKDYLAFANGDFLEQIDTSFLPNINIPQIIPLFATIKLQERRVGVMLTGAIEQGQWMFIALLPVYYLEHNFFLTQEEINAISNDPIFNSFSGSSDYGAAEQLIACHLINDSAGIGDLRITTLYRLNKILNTKALAGIDWIFPTARAVKQGILGNKFPINAPIPPFSIRELFALSCTPGQSDAAINMAKNFLLGALDRLTTIVGDSHLGTRFFSIEPFVEHTKPLTDSLNFITYGRVSYYVPHQQTRFFIVATTPQEFERDYEDPAQATANLNFLNQAFIDTLYPYQVNIKVQPGLELRFNVALNWERHNVSAALGYEYWHKNAEKFLDVSQSVATQFVIPIGLRSSAQQSKLFGYIFAHHTHEGSDTWHIGLRGDITISHQGIGRDYTIAFDAMLDY
ncbi:MAG: hypothetical protein WA432_04825 [Candidatus Babeliaceae bacterium]